MQDVGHEAVEKIFENIGFVHGVVAMGTCEAKLDVEERTDHARLCQADCILDSWLTVAAIFDCVGEHDGQEGSEQKKDLEKFHYR